MKSESKFDKLDQEWRAGMLSADDNKVNSTIVQSAISLISLELAKKLDEDLISLREQLKTASEQYSQGKKENTLRIEFLIEILRSRGIAVPDIEDYVKSAKQSLVDDNTTDRHF